MGKESIFLTTQEAIEAIISDFRQYDPQILLFSGIIPLITNDRIHLKRAQSKNGAWINRRSTAHMKWLEGPELVDYMCDAISRTPWNDHLLAAVAGRVFQTRATPHRNETTGKPGVRIETNMESFLCRQCGFCCRFLDYRNEVTAKDVALWKASGREEILKWVHEITRNGKPPKYGAWVIPGTLKPADKCPFLERASESRRWHCRIHDVKPAICRQYPLSRKHAIMSGCRGFDKKNVTLCRKPTAGSGSPYKSRAHF